jgi:hypothetical protein
MMVAYGGFLVAFTARAVRIHCMRDNGILVYVPTAENPEDRNR